MPSWGNKDAAANTPLWAVAAVNRQPTSANTAALFENTTQDYWETELDDGSFRNAGKAVGVFGVDANEADVDSKGAHTGWVLRTVGSGGRAGRVQEEVLVAMSSMTTDGNDDPVYPDVKLSITSQPSGNTASLGSANGATFRVTAAITTGNTAAPLTYQWQVNNNTGGTWVNVTNGVPANTSYSGGTSANLVVTPTDTTVDNYVLRAIVTATGTGVSATSANAKIDVVS